MRESRPLAWLPSGYRVRLSFCSRVQGARGRWRIDRQHRVTSAYDRDEPSCAK